MSRFSPRPRRALAGLTAGLLAALPVIAWSGNIVVAPFMTAVASQGTETAASDLSLRKLIVPNQGLKSGNFKWNAATNSWTLVGALAADDSYYAMIQLWKMIRGTNNSAKLDAFLGGVNVTAVTLKSPKGVVYSDICALDGIFYGMNNFNCSKDLPAGQTEFGNGAYVATYTLGTGQKVSRTYYVSGDYPLIHQVIYPADGAVGIPTKGLTFKWQSVGAAGYDVILRDAAQYEVYDTSIVNAIDASLSRTLPAAVVLKPQTTYYLTIEANAPYANGGTKGIKRIVTFKTR